MENTQPTDIYGKPYHRGLFVAVFLIGAFVMVLNQTVISTDNQRSCSPLTLGLQLCNG